VVYAESEIASYSEIERESVPIRKPPAEREMIPMNKIIEEKGNDGRSSIAPKQMPLLSCTRIVT
jgi:hypothetical protein